MGSTSPCVLQKELPNPKQEVQVTSACWVTVWKHSQSPRHKGLSHLSMYPRSKSMLRLNNPKKLLIRNNFRKQGGRVGKNKVYEGCHSRGSPWPNVAPWLRNPILAAIASLQLTHCIHDSKVVSACPFHHHSFIFNSFRLAAIISLTADTWRVKSDALDERSRKHLSHVTWLITRSSHKVSPSANCSLGSMATSHLVVAFPCCCCFQSLHPVTPSSQ